MNQALEQTHDVAEKMLHNHTMSCVSCQRLLRPFIGGVTHY